MLCTSRAPRARAVSQQGREYSPQNHAGHGHKWHRVEAEGHGQVYFYKYFHDCHPFLQTLPCPGLPCLGPAPAGHFAAQAGFFHPWVLLCEVLTPGAGSLVPFLTRPATVRRAELVFIRRNMCPRKPFLLIISSASGGIRATPCFVCRQRNGDGQDHFKLCLMGKGNLDVF